ncbi:MAG: hypothetical protein LBP81_00610 [Treponema sp.]|nr:hypothetical protein [Treponema sp.]
MKNKVRIIGAGLLALLLTLTGCFTPLNDPADTAGESSGTKIVVEVGGLDARTLAPTDLSGVKYAVTIRQDSTTTVLDEDEVDFTAAREYSLEPGTYTVNVWAYTGEYKGVALGDADVTLENGRTESVKINLSPLTGEDVSGTFSYAVVYPAILGYSEAALKLKATNPNNGSVEINFLTGGAKTADLQLPPGKYDLTVTLKSHRQITGDNSGVLQATAKETVYIYPNLTTLGKFTFTEADFSAQVYFNGWARIDAQERDLGYVPKKVQIKLFDNYEERDDANVQEADIDENGYWELLVPSEKINPGTVEEVEFRFTLKSGANEELTSPWIPRNVDNIQGVTGIDLNASIYQVSPVSGGVISGISGVNSIAGSIYAVAKTDVRLKLASFTTASGVIGRTLNVPGTSYDVESDGTVVFEMPNRDVSVNASFFHLNGEDFPTVTGTGSGQYTQAVIEAWEETSDLSLRKIAGSSTLNESGTTTWSIPIPAGYVTDPASDGSEKIYFKIILKTASGGSYEVDRADSRYLTNLVEPGINIPPFNVSLDDVSNIRAEALSATSIKLTWDLAPWATKGYNVYRYQSGYVLVSGSSAITGNSYTVTGLSAGTSYTYYVLGIRADDSTGNYTEVNGATKTDRPTDVTAERTPADELSNGLVKVSWNPVYTGNGYYDVYRDGQKINSSPMWNTYYYDSAVKANTSYTYQVVAKSYYDNADSELSTATSPVGIWGTEEISQYSGTLYRSIDSSWEVDYYRFTAQSGALYGVYFRDYTYSYRDGYGDMRLYLYKNGSFYTCLYGYGDSGEINLSSGDELIIAVSGENPYADIGSYDVELQRY